jgi:pSer/pThr/pTyr-binding forkhead associated (FHA) protein
MSDESGSRGGLPGHGSTRGTGLPAPATPRELQRVIAAEREGTPFLLYRDGDGELCVRCFAGTEALTLGRGGGCDVSLPWDAGVSALHAEVLRRGDSWLIVDEGLSMNGTFVNGERLQGRRRLRPGDVIRVGHTSLAFRQGEDAPAGETAPLTTAGAGLVEVTDAQQRVLVALCRQYFDGTALPLPATNQAIADELFLSVEAVKTHLRELYRRFGLEQLAQNEKRATLAHRAVEQGLAVPR